MIKLPIRQLFQEKGFVLFEGAIVEQLRRHSAVSLHPTLVNAPLIYDDNSARLMRRFITEYIEIAFQKSLPLLITTPTWRANNERVYKSRINTHINEDCTNFIKVLLEAHPHKDHVYIGGLIGCKNDCYKPEEGLEIEEAKEFHTWQIKELYNSSPDYLIAQTLPYLPEAIGISMAMSTTQLPYFISFVINKSGKLLDGTTIDDAIRTIDGNVKNPPMGYMINCAYPTFLCDQIMTGSIKKRLVGFVGNASSLDQCELDGAQEIKSEGVKKWAEDMSQLHREYNITSLGGCCGTSPAYISELVSSLL